MRLAGHVLARYPPPPGTVVAGYWPMRGEIDVRPLLFALLGRGHTVLLPDTPPPGQQLAFHHWRPGARMFPGRFGTQRPDGPIGMPDVLLVPLLAFDPAGHRLGYGGGYYDRTIAAMPWATTIGCAFACQRMDHVPTESHDRPLDIIVTEHGIAT